MTATRTTDTLRVLSTVFVPTLATGVIKRRPTLMSLVDRLGGDERAIREVARLRDRYGDEPLRLCVPGRSVALAEHSSKVRSAGLFRTVLVLSPDDVGATPAPFHPASTDKVAALRQFQPHAVLITRDRRERAVRRAANEQALDTGQPLHHLAEPIHEVIREEATPATTRS